MKVLRIALTVFVIGISCILEFYASAQGPTGPGYTYIQIQEWHHAMITIRVLVPIVAIIAILAVWWEPLKQLTRKDT
jgi:hypothetical protein